MSTINENVLLNDSKKISVIAFLYALFFLLAPMEDLLTGPIGTVAKFLAIIIMVIGLFQCKGKLRLNFKEIPTLSICWLMILSVLSVIWSINRDTTMHRLTAYLLIPGFCVFSNIFKFEKKQYETIVSASIIGGVIASAVAYINGNFLAGRLILTEANDPNNFAALIFLPASLAWDRMQNGTKKKKLLYAAVFVLFSFIILYTGSRGVLISLLVMVVVYFLLSGKTKSLRILLIAALLVFLIWKFIIPILPSNIASRVLNPSMYSSNASRRTIIWRYLVKDIIPNLPVWGLGAGTVSLELANYYGKVNGAHNTYLNMIGEFGVFGIPVFIMMFISYFHKLIKRNRIMSVSLLAGICVVIFFLDSFAKKFFWNVILLIILQNNTLESPEPSEEIDIITAENNVLIGKQNDLSE